MSKKNDSLKLLEEYKSLFDRIDYYRDMFQNKTYNTPGEFNEALVELTGIYSSIHPVALNAETEKLHHEETYKQKKREKMIGLDYEEVTKYRRLRNIFVGARDCCEKMMSTCQSSLRYLLTERNYTS